MDDVSHMVFSDHNPFNNASAPTIDPNIPVFNYSSIPEHLFVAKPTGSDVAQRTRILMLSVCSGSRLASKDLSEHMTNH